MNIDLRVFVFEEIGSQSQNCSDTLCERIDDFIMNEIIPSNIDSQSIESIAHDIRQINCDGIILGCTELPAVFSEIQLGIPVIDTTRLLAQKALEFAV